METEEASKWKLLRGGRWKSVFLWSASVTGLLTAYLFVYPVLLIYLDSSSGFDIESKVPDWLYDGIGVTAEPILYLMSNSVSYNDYIEWWLSEIS